MLKAGLLSHLLDWVVSCHCSSLRLILTSVVGFLVGQIRAIFHPIWNVPTKQPLYLAYVQRFDIIPQTHLPRGMRHAPDPIHGMYVLRRAYRSDGQRMGAIVPLYHLRTPVHLIPRFGEK